MRVMPVGGEGPGTMRSRGVAGRATRPPRGARAQRLTADRVLAELRGHDFAVLSTADAAGQPHAAGVTYGVSPPGRPLAVYVMTRRHLQKARDVAQNPRVALVVPLPRRLLWFVPPATIQLRGRTALLGWTDPEGTDVFRRSWLGRRILAAYAQARRRGETRVCFLKLTPDPVAHTYGVGYSAWALRRRMEAAAGTVVLPAAPPASRAAVAARRCRLRREPDPVPAGRSGRVRAVSPLRVKLRAWWPGPPRRRQDGPAGGRGAGPPGPAEGRREEAEETEMPQMRWSIALLLAARHWSWRRRAPRPRAAPGVPAARRRRSRPRARRAPPRRPGHGGGGPQRERPDLRQARHARRCHPRAHRRPPRVSAPLLRPRWPQERTGASVGLPTPAPDGSRSPAPW